MRINIPECQKMGVSNMGTLIIIICMLEYGVKRLYNKYQVNTINDIKGYTVTFAIKLIKSLRTLVVVIEEQKDYVVANAILRMLADNISIFKLIYGNSDYKELIFRHYLYILDGSSARFKELPEAIYYDGKITKEEFMLLEKQIKTTREAEQININYCMQILKNHPYSATENKVIDNIIQKSNWKYKSIDSLFKEKNVYTWKELYSLLEMSQTGTSFFSYLSQYVHGLSISNIQLEEDNDDFEPIICTGVCLSGFLKETLFGIFQEDEEYMMEGYLTSPQGIEHWSNLGEQYRERLINIISDSDNK